MPKELEKLAKDLCFMQRLDPFGAINYFLHGMGYLEYAREGWAENEKKQEEGEQAIAQLLERSREFADVKQLLAYIASYERRFEENQTEDGSITEMMKGEAARRRNLPEGNSKAKMTEEPCVGIMTYHAAKGLEFDHVFLPYVNAGAVPHGRMLTQEQLEEERRMFYVAMTRAKKSLCISGTGSTQGEHECSLFIRELQ
jgi:DNA helicase-2/ATP-dependent DNA helicase PcrA